MKLVLNKYLKYGENLNIKFLNYYIRAEGPLGVIEKRFLFKYNKIYFVWNNKNFKNLIIVSNKFLKFLLFEITRLLAGVYHGWYIGFNITGRGFTFRIKKYNNNYYLKIKIGYSHFIYYLTKKNLWINISKKKNKLFLYSLDFWYISKIANQIRNLRSKHTYKLQGISFFDEHIVVKQGKQKQI